MPPNTTTTPPPPQNVDTSLSHVHIFGLAASVKNNIHFTDEGVIVYPVGNNVAVYHTDTREQNVIQCKSDIFGSGNVGGGGVGTGTGTTGTITASSSSANVSESITTLTVTPNKRYIAISTRTTNNSTSSNSNVSNTSTNMNTNTTHTETTTTNNTNNPTSGLGVGVGVGVVHMYDSTTLRRKKTLFFPDLNSPEITHISFSPDSKLCLTLGGAPDYTMVLWSVDKSVKVLTSIKLNTPNSNVIKRADFNTNDQTVLCVTGNGVLRFFRIVESTFRPITLTLKRELANYTTHCWLPYDRIVISSVNGELLIVENFEFKCILTCSPNDGKSIACIVSFSKGFITGSENGVMRIYEPSSDTREYYKLAKQFTLKGFDFSNANATIQNIAISPSEDLLVCTTDDNQVYSFSLSNTDILKEDGTNFELLLSSFHSPNALSGDASITGLDTCICKPLLVSCGADCTVRVWNYLERTLELTKTFPTPCISLAMHPSGLHVLVSFSDHLLLCSVLIDTIHTIKQINVKHCRVLKFSNGGQYFAFVSAVGSNTAVGSNVHVYGTYTGEVVSTLRGHNGVIKNVHFKQGDRSVCSVGGDGVIHVYSVTTGVKEGEYACMGMGMGVRNGFSCGAWNSDFSRCYAGSGSWAGDGSGNGNSTGNNTGNSAGNGNTKDGGIKEFDLTNLTLKAEIPNDVPISSLVVSGSHKLLFTGTCAVNKPGAIKVFKISNTITSTYAEFTYHSMGITCMKVSHDNAFLFTASSDGSLCILNVNDIEYKSPPRKTTEQRENNTDYAEEILVTKSDLEEKSMNIERMHGKVEELTLNNEYQLRLKDINYKEKIREVSVKFTNELEADADKYESLLDEKREMETEYEEKLRMLEIKHSVEFKDLEVSYNGKINTEVVRYESLIAERQVQNEKWDAENQALVEAHTAYLQDITDDYDKKVDSEQRMQNLLSVEKGSMIVKFEKMKDMVEEDAELEVDEQKIKNDGKLASERRATLRLRGENAFMKKKYDTMIKDVNDQKEEIGSLHDKERELHEAIKGLEKDIQGHKKEIREREETIVDKEKRIYELKKKNQELEKFKFVLDYKIKELKRQIEPRENEIADMRTQIEEMDLELEQYHKSNSALDLMIGELRLKMDGMNKEISTQRDTIDEGGRFIAKFRKDLSAAAAKVGVGDGKGLKDATMALYKMYAQDEKVASASASSNAKRAGESKGGGGGGDGGSGGGEIQSEYNRQREHLERSVDALKRNITKDVDLHTTDHNRLVRENVALTKEINELRRESKDLQLQDLGMEKDYIATVKNIGNGSSSSSSMSIIPPTPPTESGSGKRGVRRSKDALAPRAGSHMNNNGNNENVMNGEAAMIRDLELQNEIVAQLEDRIKHLSRIARDGDVANGQEGGREEFEV